MQVQVTEEGKHTHCKCKCKQTRTDWFPWSLKKNVFKRIPGSWSCICLTIVGTFQCDWVWQLLKQGREKGGIQILQPKTKLNKKERNCYSHSYLLHKTRWKKLINYQVLRRKMGRWNTFGMHWTGFLGFSHRSFPSESTWGETSAFKHLPRNSSLVGLVCNSGSSNVKWDKTKIWCKDGWVEL